MTDTTPSLVLLPAVDIMGGRAVQLVRGKRETARDFGDPVDAAMRWCTLGAEWLHVVDLDAAFGLGDNRDIIARIADEVPANIEVSGGVRDDTALEKVLGTGCARVSIGTAVVKNPEWCADVLARFGEAVTISLDAADGKLASHGWLEASGSLFEKVAEMTQMGCRRFIVTDTARDGMMQGPNVELLAAVCARTTAAVIASGGISTIDDIRRLRGMTATGIEGAIIGTALYEGGIDLSAALALAGAVD